MSIPMNCTCGKSLKVRPDFAGKRVRCPQCQTVLTVPIPVPDEVDPLGTNELAGQVLDKATQMGTQAAEKAGAAIRGVSTALTGMLSRKSSKETEDDTPAPEGPTNIIPATAQSLPVPTPRRRTVFEHLTAQRQDPAIVEKVVDRVSKILTANEQLKFIAIQQRPIINWFPDCIVLTDRRIILYQPKIFGRVDMMDFIWRRVRNARLSENIIGSTMSFDVVNDKSIVLDYLPKEQARELYRFAQEAEEAAHEERRLRQMEEDRAKAGGVQIMQNIGAQGNGQAAPVDPVQKLQQLKQLLEAGLLTPAEYESKRAELIKLL